MDRASTVITSSSSTTLPQPAFMNTIGGKLLTEHNFFQLVGCTESGSKHPIGKSLYQHCKQYAPSAPSTSELDLLQLKEEDREITTLPGEGISCKLMQYDNNLTVHVGTLAFLQRMGAPTGNALSEQHEEMMKRVAKNEKIGRTVVWVGFEQSPSNSNTATTAATATEPVHNQQKQFTVLGYIALQDTVKPEAKAAIEELHALSIKTMILSGDKRQSVRHIAKQLGIDKSMYEVLPSQKAQQIQKLQKKGHTVAMVGDGINDSPSLVQADVGIAIGAGADVAIATSDIVLVKNNLLDVVRAIDLSKFTFARIQFNYILSLGYNVLFIPLAAGIAFPLLQKQLPPMVAAVLMWVSSLAVLISSLLLRLYRRDAIAELREPKVYKKSGKDSQLHNQL